MVTGPKLATPASTGDDRMNDDCAAPGKARRISLSMKCPRASFVRLVVSGKVFWDGDEATAVELARTARRLASNRARRVGIALFMWIPWMIGAMSMTHLNNLKQAGVVPVGFVPARRSASCS
jgi:hypothetical protein